MDGEHPEPGEQTLVAFTHQQYPAGRRAEDRTDERRHRHASIQRALAAGRRNGFSENKIDGEQKHARQNQRLDYGLCVMGPADQQSLSLYPRLQDKGAHRRLLSTRAYSGTATARMPASQTSAGPTTDRLGQAAVSAEFPANARSEYTNWECG